MIGQIDISPQYLGALRKIGKSAYMLHRACLSLLLFVRSEQLGSHWTDFHKT